MVFKNDTSRRRFRSKSRIRTITEAFLAAIAVGTLLLMLPFCRSGAGRADLLTALFTATSATCVTGLSVVDTATYWSAAGRLVILCLIQVGGLGIMMLGASVALAVRRRITIGQRLLISTSLNLEGAAGIVRLARMILRGTLLFEGAGAVALTLFFLPDFGFWGALERGVFLSVSAFCNAGFDNLGVGGRFASITPYGDHVGVLLTLSVLIIVGGIGFYVWNEMLEVLRGKRRLRRLTLHTRMVLTATAVLLLAGMAGFFIAEAGNTGAGASGGLRLLQAFFQSVTCRTAGFDHLGQGNLSSASIALSDILMFIGGSPGSVAGGIKTTTVSVLVLSAWSTLRGKKRTEAFGRTIPQKSIFDAMMLFFLAFSAALLGGLIISIGEGAAFEAAFYECISAIATVGLSTGLTPALGTGSRLLLILLMFLGRVGIITVGMAALTRESPDDSVRLPEGRILIG